MLPIVIAPLLAAGFAALAPVMPPSSSASPAPVRTVTSDSSAEESWKDKRGDTLFPAADILSWSTENSIREISLILVIAEDSFAAKKQSSVVTELDITEDGKPDVVIAAQAPYVEAEVTSTRGKRLCVGEAQYSSGARGTARVEIVIPGKCLKYALGVAARHSFYVSSEEESAFDTAGKLTQVVFRDLRDPSVKVKRAGSKVGFSVSVDPTYAGESFSVQVKQGKKWARVASGSVSAAGLGEATARGNSVPRRGLGRILVDNVVVANFNIR